ncbi:MAG: S41 family peptidase [Monoglobales bacterium]
MNSENEFFSKSDDSFIVDGKEKKSKKHFGKGAIFISIIISVVVTAFITSIVCRIPYMGLDESTRKFEVKLSAINALLKSEYLYDIDDEAMQQNALQAYVEGLEEPYTHYYTTEEFKEYTEQLEDSYVGIGVVVTKNDNNQIEVVSAFEGSPAYNAEVLPGDILAAVDGVDYTGDEMEEAVAKIKSGKEKEKVTIKFIRNGEEIVKEIERGNVSSESVRTQMLDNNIGYVRISAFNTNDAGNEEDTYTEFKSKVEALQAEGMQKMIIDLRDNPGGALDVACNIADMIVPEGLITYIEYKDGKRQDYESDANEMDMPIVILINENSASASEVLTGCLKDYGKATIVGKKSFGKGIVQSVYPFVDGSGISMTVAKYYSPNGICIHGTGITPDVEVDAPEAWDGYYASSIPFDEDTQLQKAIEILNK